jgi:predicted amidohydrolase
MGVVVAEDLYFAEMVNALAVCGCDFIVCSFGRVINILQSVLLRAYAFRFGIPLLFCAQGYCMLATPAGELEFASPQSPVYFEVDNKKEYHLLETRKRMCFPFST